MAFYNFIHNAKGNEDALYIDGEIASESWYADKVNPRKFRGQLEPLGDVTVYINSPGGDVFAGAEIYSALREHKGKVTVKITGIAASMASVIAMAGDEILMSPVAYFMMHNPWTALAGNASHLEQAARMLREVGEGLVTAYQQRTKKTRDEINELLEAETYMNAQTAIEEGFADGFSFEETQANINPMGKPERTLMRASKYGQAAVFAMMQRAPREDGAFSAFAALHIPTSPALPMPGAFELTRQRDDIAQRARILASIYHKN